MTEEQLDIIGRLVQFTLWKSMNKLRKHVKYEFTHRGWKEDLKKFKLRQTQDGVEILLNPKYL